MQSTETDQVARTDLDTKARDLITVHEGRAILCRIYDKPDKTSNDTAEVLTSLLVALAAERDRADRAETRIAKALETLPGEGIVRAYDIARVHHILSDAEATA